MKSSKIIVAALLLLFSVIYSVSAQLPQEIYQGISFRNDSSKSKILLIENARGDRIQMIIPSLQKVALARIINDSSTISVLVDAGARSYKSEGFRSYHVEISENFLMPPTNIGGFTNRYFFLYEENVVATVVDSEFFESRITVRLLE